MTLQFLTAKEFGPLNSREVATLIWVGLLIVAATTNHRIRSSFKELLKVVFKGKIIAIYSLFISWCILCTIILNTTGLWTISLLKDTIVWILFSGLTLVGRSVQSQKDTPSFKQRVKDILGITVVVEFICNLYTFPLWAETMSLPVLISLLILHTYAKNTPEIESVYRLLGYPILLADLVILGYVGNSLYWQSQKLLSQDGLSQFSLPLILAFLSVPALHLIGLYSSYEKLNTALNKNGRTPFTLKFYICLKLLEQLRLNIRNVRLVHQRFIGELMAIQTHDEADEVFTSISRWSDFRRGGPKAIKMRSIERSWIRSTEINWPLIPLFKTPWIAAEYVIQLGLNDTSNEEPIWRFRDEEWYALSQLDVKTDDIFSIGNTITCMHSSTDEAFIEWSRWTLNVFDPKIAEITEEKFFTLIGSYLAYLKCDFPPDLFRFSSNMSQRQETPQAVFEIQNFSYSQGYSRQITITSKFN